ncbi:TipJ family phage tail tip protein [Hansschlegelia sp.]|uniref:TipJ family phage tail tip protein n=1 Tax=Hansschlegelia sp. TaxID=2041892 RepID=UPI002C924294|nr:phage tail protein [Hansschlegelia sp.]HVI28870.1 phage tail protein [Hansschlegelia sp.]
MRPEEAKAAPKRALWSPDAINVVLRSLIEKEDTSAIQIPPGASVAEAVRLRTPNLTDAERAALRVVSHERSGGHVIDARHRERVRLKAGAVLVITDPPAGGALRQILQVVVSVVALTIATVIGGPFGAIVAGAFAFGANYLVNLLVPVKTPDQKKPSPLYSIQGFKNPLNIDAPIPLPVGLRHRFAPPYAVPPYIDIQNGKVYLTAAFCCGYAPMALWKERIGDRLLTRFDSRFYQVEYRGFLIDGEVDTSPFTLVTETVIQTEQQITLTHRDDGVSEDDDGILSEPSSLFTAPDTARWKVIWSFPGGLVRYTKKKGKKQSATVNIRIRQRPVTENNDGAWTVIEANWAMHRKDRDPFFVEYEHEITVEEGGRGAYEVEFLRLNDDDDTNRESSKIEIVAFQSILPEYPINQPADTPFALVAVRIKANNQLKGTLDEYNAEFASLIDALNPETGLYEPLKETGNPADWYRRLKTMPQNAKAIGFDELNAAELIDWHAHNAANDLMFSRVYDYEVAADAAIRDVCAVGRAVPRLTNGYHGVTIDRPKDPLTAYPITPHNSWGPEGHRSYKDLPHAFRIKFKDRTNDFKTAIREVERPGFAGDPTLFEEIEPPGVTDPTAAYVWGYKLWLELLHRPDDYTRNLDWEHRQLDIGDLVAMSDRVLVKGVQSGTVLGVDGRIVALSEPVSMTTGKSYMAKFRRIVQDGDGSRAEVLFRGVTAIDGETRTLLLTGSGEMPEEGDLAWFGETGFVDVLGVIQHIEVSEGERGRLTIVDQAPQIFEALDALIVPPWSSRVGDVLEPDARTPPSPVIARVLSDDSVYDDEEPVPDSPRRVVAYVEQGEGLPLASAFKLRHRIVGAGAWSQTGWTLFGAGFVTIEGVYAKGDEIELQPLGRTRLGVESATWGATFTHEVGQNDAVGPSVTLFEVNRLGAAGLNQFVWESADATATAEIRCKATSALPGGWEALSDEAQFSLLDPLHTGVLTGSPWIAEGPDDVGDYLVGIRLTSDDGDPGAPFTDLYEISATPAPAAPASFAATLDGATVHLNGRNGNSLGITAARFYRTADGDTFDPDADDITGPLYSAPNQTLPTIDDAPGPGTWIYRMTDETAPDNRSATLAAAPVTIV